ncbi:hypothetical protein [Escherichia coli]|nr:hypothetical protein [Escherichia coli]
MNNKIKKAGFVMSESFIKESISIQLNKLGVLMWHGMLCDQTK